MGGYLRMTRRPREAHRMRRTPKYRKEGPTKMVKHIILWQLKDEFTLEEKTEIKAGIKEGLESLKGKIPGLVDIRVQTESLASSTAEVMLDSTFEDEAALKGYSVHPEHVKVADGKVRPYTKTRSCLDFEI